MSRIIEIKKVHVKYLLISFVIGFITLYGLEHFGEFSYLTESSGISSNEKPSLSEYIPWTTKVSQIYYQSYFENEVKTEGNGFDVSDVNNSDTEFNKYAVLSFYYTKALIADLKYGIYISFTIFIIILLLTNIKIKLT